MGPKKKGKKKKEVPLDSIKSTTEMTAEQLGEYAWRLWQEAEKQRNERDWFHVEKEKIRTFLHIDRMHLMETYSALRNKDRELCEVLRRQEAELIKQREEVKAAHMEQALNVVDGKVSQVQKLKISRDEQHGRLVQLQNDLEHLQRLKKMGEISFKEDMKRETKEYNKEMRELLEDLENKAQCLEKKFDVLLEADRVTMIRELTAKQKETETRKNKQLAMQRVLLDNVRFDLTQYYNTVTVNNLTLVKSLKNELEAINTTYGRARNLCREAEKRNRNMKQPLENARTEIETLKKELADVEIVRRSILQKKNELAEKMAEKEALSVELEVLKTRYHKLAQEHKFLLDTLLKEALVVQHRQSLEFVLLQERLKTVQRLLEASDLQQSKALSIFLKDPQQKCEARDKLKAILQEKNAAIDDLKEQLSRALKAHNVLVKTLQIKMERFGMQDADLGFKTRELYK